MDIRVSKSKARTISIFTAIIILLIAGTSIFFSSNIEKAKDESLSTDVEGVEIIKDERNFKEIDEDLNDKEEINDGQEDDDFLVEVEDPQEVVQEVANQDDEDGSDVSDTLPPQDIDELPKCTSTKISALEEEIKLAQDNLNEAIIASEARYDDDILYCQKDYDNCMLILSNAIQDRNQEIALEGRSGFRSAERELDDMLYYGTIECEKSQNECVYNAELKKTNDIGVIGSSNTLQSFKDLLNQCL